MVNFVPVLCILTSIYTLVAMAYERRRAVVYHHLSAVSGKSAVIVCVIIWVVAFAISLPTLIEFNVYEVLGPSPNTDVEDDFSNSTITLSTEQTQLVVIRQCGHVNRKRTSVLLNGVFLLCLAYVIPLILMIFYYGHIANYIINRTKTVRYINVLLLIIILWVMLTFDT
jgi:hypothetical protein